jgi:hypothetical protein
MLYVFAVHFAYKVTSAVVAYGAVRTVPVVVVDQPAKVYPVLTMVPTVGKVEMVGVVEFTNTSVDRDGDPLFALLVL